MKTVDKTRAEAWENAIADIFRPTESVGGLLGQRDATGVGASGDPKRDTPSPSRAEEDSGLSSGRGHGASEAESRRAYPAPPPEAWPSPPAPPETRPSSPAFPAPAVRRDIYLHLTDEEMRQGGLFTSEGYQFSLSPSLRNGMVVPVPEIGKEVHIRRKKPAPARVTLLLTAAEAKVGGAFHVALPDGTKRSLSLPGNLIDGQVVSMGPGDIEIIIQIRRGLFGGFFGRRS